MMMKKIFAAAALSLLASSAFATPPGYYGGLDVGSTKVDGLDDNKTGYGAFLGYGFNRFVAVELGYRQLGKGNLYGADVTVKQTHVSVIGSYPLAPQFDVYGRLGYSDIRAEASYGGNTGSATDSGGMYGVGLNYDFTPAVSGRLEVQKPTSDSTYYNVGVVFKF
jgi:predicted porin